MGRIWPPSPSLPVPDLAATNSTLGSIQLQYMQVLEMLQCMCRFIMQYMYRKLYTVGTVVLPIHSKSCKLDSHSIVQFKFLHYSRIQIILLHNATTGKLEKCIYIFNIVLTLYKKYKDRGINRQTNITENQIIVY